MVTNSQENNCDGSAPESLEDVSIIYEFPDDNLETASYFDLPKEEIVDGETVDMETNNKTTYLTTNQQTSNSGLTTATTSASMTDKLIPRDLETSLSDGKLTSSHCVIQIENDDPMSVSDLNESNLDKDGTSSLENTCNSNIDHSCNTKSRANKRPFTKEMSSPCNLVKKKTKCNIRQNSSKESTNGLLSSSSSEGALADVEDNIETQSEILQNSNKVSENQNKPANQFHKYSHDSLQSISQNNFTKESSRSESNIPSKTTKSNVDSTSSKSNHLKARSEVTRNKKRKCHVCSKKLDLTAITCRCGGTFCSKHRYDREHNCTFDYKAMGAEKIKKENPQIIAQKVRKL